MSKSNKVTIISGSNKNSFKLCLNDKLVSRFIAITVQNIECIIEAFLCEVVNRSLENPHIHHHVIENNDEISKGNVFVYTGVVIGEVCNGEFKFVNETYTLKPCVYLFSEYEISKKMFNYRDLRIGQYNTEDLYVDSESLLKSGLWVIGRPRMGKTNFLKNVLVQDAFKSNQPIFILEYYPTDRYDFIRNPTCEINITSDFISNIVSLSTRDIAIVEEYISIMKGEKKISAKEFARGLLAYYSGQSISNVGSATYVNIQNICNELQLDFIFEEDDMKQFESSLVLRLANNPPDIKNVIMEQYIDKAIKHILSSSSTKKFLFVFEDAHEYIPSTGSTVLKTKITRLVREASKRGHRFIFVSHRPKHIDQVVSDFCGNRAIFNLQNDDDIKHLLPSSIITRAGLVDKIQTFRTGEFLLYGQDYPVPFRICTTVDK